MQFFWLVFIIIIWFIAIAWTSLAPFVPSFKKDLGRINKIIKLKKWDNFLEIWSWIAIVSSYIAKNNPENNIYAIELALPLYLYSVIKNKLFWYKNLKIMFWNALKLDFWDYDFIYIFGLKGSLNKLLKPKIINELKNNAKFISYAFSINAWDYNYIENKPKEDDISIHIYSKN